MNRLSDTERELLARAIDVADDRWQHGIGSGGYDVNGPPLWLVDAPETLAAVEAIVAARLASVKALVADWQANGNSRELGDPRADVWHKCAEQLLAVLGSDAHTEQKGAGEWRCDHTQHDTARCVPTKHYAKDDTQ